eukprot:COSAG01_NODE_70980_length_257_cov_0.658228_1_plen_25_part_01
MYRRGSTEVEHTAVQLYLLLCSTRS